MRNPEEYRTNIDEGKAGSPACSDPGNYVPVQVTPTFFNHLSQQKDHRSFFGHESGWSLGKPIAGQENFSKLIYLGSHGSDSGLTCLIDASPFASPDPIDSKSAVQPVDWPEFVLSIVGEEEGDLEQLEEYRLYKFFGKVPVNEDGDETGAAVYGLSSEADQSSYDTIVIKRLPSK